jgi:hypothetical protein
MVDSPKLSGDDLDLLQGEEPATADAKCRLHALTPDQVTDSVVRFVKAATDVADSIE